MPGHTFEHNAAVHKLRDLVRGGHLGRLFYLDCARLNLGLYQSDVNVIFDLAPHDISISNFVLGATPTAVTVWGSRHVHPEHEDVAYLRLDYADLGVRSNIHVSWLDPRKVRRITAVGSAKMAEYDDMADDERIRIYDKSAIPPDGNGGPLSGVAYHLGDMVAPFVPFAEPLAVQDQHFVDCIAGDSSPSVDGSNGLAVVQALECAQISLREQRPVALAEVAQRQAGSPAGLDATIAWTSVG
jgi:predicted dehydrogenase